MIGCMRDVGQLLAAVALLAGIALVALGFAEHGVLQRTSVWTLAAAVLLFGVLLMLGVIVLFLGDFEDLLKERK